jgi:hypothetical protein
MKVMTEVWRGDNMNERLYLLVLGSTINSEEVKEFIDSQECITDWFRSMPNSFFLVSGLFASGIYERIRSKFKEGRLFLTEVSPTNRQGWLPRSHWTKINHINA